jgi:hypothetical protein
VEPGGAPRELHPESPCRSSWAGTWYVARQGEVPPRRIRHPRGDGCGEGSSFHVCPLDRVRDLTPPRGRQTQGGCTPATARSQATAACPQGCAAAPVRPSRPQPSTVDRKWRPRGATKQGSPQHPLRLASRWNSFRRRRGATLERRKAREPSRSVCRRQCRKRLGPGSRRVCADVCLPRKVDTPPCIVCRLQAVYASVRFGRSSWAVACGIVGPALNKCVASQSATAGASLTAREPVLRDGATSETAPRCNQRTALRCPRDYGRPGVKLLPLSRVAPATGAAGLFGGSGLSRDAVVESRSIEDSVL